MNRKVALAVLVAAFAAVVDVGFRPVHLRVWNTMGKVDILVMVCLILPFLIAARFVRPRLRVTRYAWVLCAVMALDVVFFAVPEFGLGGGGHPSLESLGSYFLALAKLLLVPVTLILLGVACVKGEQMLLVTTGFLCLAGEALYASYPTGWWSGP